MSLILMTSLVDYALIPQQKNMALFTIGDLIILGYKEERARDTLSTRESKLCNKNKNKIVISNSPFKKRGRKF